MSIPFPQTKSLMLGGASIAVLTLAIVSTEHMRVAPLAPLDLTTTGTENAVAGAQAPTESRKEADDAQEASPTAPSIAPVPVAEADVSQALPKLRSKNAAPRRAAAVPSQPSLARAPAAPAGAGSVVLGGQRRLDESVLDALVDREEEASSPVAQENRDQFQAITDNPVHVTTERPVSTFSIDVDTASYSVVRSSLMNGVLPPKDAVRVEELINYFPYDYRAPTDPDTPFVTRVSVVDTPWNAETRLMHVAIKGYDIAPTERPRANLVFLIDTSGSMSQPNKLPLLKNAFRMMVEGLDKDDTVSIVVYAGSAGTVLEPTKVENKAQILDALDRLSAGGSTAGGEGIRQAYRLAEQSFDESGVNRIFLATDGDFNIGITDRDELKGFVERKRESGVFLSVLGFGRGNYNDALMQILAQNGNGTAAYIDTLSEARKTLVEEASAALFPIAKDVKIQVEFNPATVAEYRLIGYETRLLNREDFNNDRVDAGEIGSGHSVTALYEITPTAADARQIDALRYAPTTSQATDPSDVSDEYAFIRLRHKQPGSDTSTLMETPVGADNLAALAEPALAEARFAISVAAFGQMLRGGRYTGSYTYDDVADLALTAKGGDPFGYRAEFINLTRLAKSASAFAPQ